MPGAGKRSRVSQREDPGPGVLSLWKGDVQHLGGWGVIAEETPRALGGQDPLTPTPPPPVAKTPSVIEALSQPSKPAQPGVSQSKPPPLPPQPPSRLPQKKPAPGADKPTPLIHKGQPRGPGNCPTWDWVCFCLVGGDSPGMFQAQRSPAVDLSGTEALGPLSNAMALQPPAPMPRKSQATKLKPKRVKALYNCVADNPDELTFSEGDVIIVDGEEDQEWWLPAEGCECLSPCVDGMRPLKGVSGRVSSMWNWSNSLHVCPFQIGHIDGDPGRKGAFPVSFVHFIAD
ncbi:Arf-GAP with SH3 domain, ANK repeat and PH domain-containing protein 2 [Tupaia chinensis]|uniref:Arf-GAP with SH3 domain, ANK repeat and PH domain-containing protein 2 n=1 Tax=Tupaia chinensis TaxID=246437 RepID=L9LB00_TUPCH|nr:Arf-GAP with SH3 domain, ANK repeat and PH domain-containing protein 2 [Tupaia chinensis]